MSNPEREEKLVRRALAARILEKRSERWARRYDGLIDEGELRSLGNFALPGIVRKYRDELGAFEDYVRRSVDFAMLTGIRVEARHQRIDRAAQLATADLLALRRGRPGATPREQLDELSQLVAAATFAAATEEATRGGEDDMIARQEYATAMRVIQAMLQASPPKQQELFTLLYAQGRTQQAAKEALGVHESTVARWHDQVLAAIRRELEKRGITHAPGRGGAPRVALSVLRGGRDDDDGEPER